MFLGLWLGLCLQARAAGPSEISDMRLEHADEGFFLSASLRFDLPLGDLHRHRCACSRKVCAVGANECATTAVRGRRREGVVTDVSLD